MLLSSSNCGVWFVVVLLLYVWFVIGLLLRGVSHHLVGTLYLCESDLGIKRI